MSQVYVSYDSVDTLIRKFRNIDIDSFLFEEIPNFVLLKQNLYYGSYGGLLYDEVIKGLSDKCISDKIGNDLSLVWWHSPHPSFVGHSLSFRDRVAVTPFIYERLQLNPIRKMRSGKSSYYGDRAWIM